MTPVFLDTVGLLALWDESDQWHAAAQTAFAQLAQGRARLVATSYIFLECGNAAARRPYRNDVDELRQELAAQGNLIIPSVDDEKAAWQAYRRAEAAGAGIVDQVSFVVMRRLGLTQAFTCDGHFRAAGFEALF